MVRLILFALLLLLQYPLWFGKGGWFRVFEVKNRLAEVEAENSALEKFNTSLQAEVVDLQEGLEAVEERARVELGLIKHDEIYVQLPRTSPTKP